MVPEQERVRAEVGPGTAQDRAWERVALECPDRRPAQVHRDGGFVHVVPMGYGDDVHCVAAEPVPGYPGFSRPRGGHVDLIPRGAVVTKQEPMKAVYPRKTRVFDMAEMAGRQR